MLDECGANYEIALFDFAKREHKTPEFLKINPRQIACVGHKVRTIWTHAGCWRLTG
jgi:hypothetical protein